MYQRTMTGPVVPELATMEDLDGREVMALTPLLALILLFGFFPKPLIDVINPAVETTLTRVGAEDPQPAVSSDDVPAAEEAHE
jgi:NADH-quinone oxidoreductase subunit M